MILPDVNVLVFAYRREAARHADYAAWLADAAAGPEELALTELTVSGFVRIVTNPRILADPAPAAQALAFLDELRAARSARWITSSDAVHGAFGEIVESDRQVRGNLVPDAWLAALAIAHGARIATADRGFARFARLRWFDPASA